MISHPVACLFVCAVMKRRKKKLLKNAKLNKAHFLPISSYLYFAKILCTNYNGKEIRLSWVPTGKQYSVSIAKMKKGGRQLKWKGSFVKLFIRPRRKYRHMKVSVPYNHYLPRSIQFAGLIHLLHKSLNAIKSMCTPNKFITYVLRGNYSDLNICIF